jgi:hypothetical protein
MSQMATHVLLEKTSRAPQQTAIKPTVAEEGQKKSGAPVAGNARLLCLISEQH